MGFGNQSQGNRVTYVNIVGGKLSIKAQEGDEGAVSRVNKNEVTVWEKHYPNLTGTLVSVECKMNEKLKANEYILTIDDVGTIYKLSIPCDSNYGDSFAVRLPNLKAGQIYTFTPFDFEDKTKKNNKGEPAKIIGISIKQGDDKIQPYYTKEEPKDRPQGEKGMDADDYKVYKIKLRKFYRSLVDKFATANDGKFAGYEQKETPKSKPSQQISQMVDGCDEVPF
jgi:hypothetical protein